MSLLAYIHPPLLFMLTVVSHWWEHTSGSDSGPYGDSDPHTL